MIDQAQLKKAKTDYIEMFIKEHGESNWKDALSESVAKYTEVRVMAAKVFGKGLEDQFRDVARNGAIREHKEHDKQLEAFIFADIVCDEVFRLESIPGDHN